MKELLMCKAELVEALRQAQGDKPKNISLQNLHLRHYRLRDFINLWRSYASDDKNLLLLKNFY
jgi:hypothetical protein